MTPGRSGPIPLIVLWGVALGCATPQSRPALETTGLPPHALVANVPFYEQRTDECGPAALAMLLGWSGVEVSPDELVEEVYLPARKGSLQTALVSSARRHGRLATPVRGGRELLEEIAAGRPVLVLQNLGLSWYRVWHYAVVVGYDLERATVVLHTGRTPQHEVGITAFQRSWSHSDDWGMVALVPGDLPVAADAQVYLEAAVGLERAQRFAEAALSFEAATSRWPTSLVAWMGLGNARYAQGDLAGAEDAFRRATSSNPDAPVAFNNLALVLWEQGRREQALEAVERALELGGPLSESFEATLETIRSGPRH